MKPFNLFSLLAFVLFISNSANSQSPTFQKVFPHGDYGAFFWNVGAFATSSEDGGYLVASSVSSFPGTNLIFLKTDANGDTLWTSEIETPEELHNVTSITTTPEGEYFVQGTYNVEGTNYQQEVFVQKFDNSGNSVDYLQLTSSGICCWDYSTGKMIRTSDDHYFLTGQYFGISDNYGTYFKIDESGAIQWSGVFDGTGGANVSRSIELSDDGFLLGGNYLLASVQEAYVQKVNANGNYVWGENFLHPDTDSGTKNKIFGMHEMPDGYLLAMNYEADANKNLQLIKVDFDGNTVWTEDFIGKGNNIDMIATDDGGFVFAGYKSQEATGFDYRLFKMDSEFNIEFDLFYGTVKPDVLHSLEQTSDNGFLLAGRSGPIGVGNKDVYLVKTDSVGCLDNEADFSFVLDGSQVSFVDESTFGVLSDSESYFWDFGDGTTSPDQNPTHVYDNFGVYEVCLTAGNICGTTTICQTIENCPEGMVNSISETACNSFTWNDNTYFESGIFLDTLTSTFGCDSIVELNLTINSVVASVSQNDTALYADAADADYQWLDCDDNFAELSGETNQFFYPEQSGSYAVEVSKDGCVETSACYPFVITSLQEIGDEINRFVVYPNPTGGTIIIEKVNSASLGQLPYQITDMTGKVILQGVMTNDKLTIDLPGVTQGIYFLRIEGQTMRLMVY